MLADEAGAARVAGREEGGPGEFVTNERGHLLFAGCDTVELARTYGTPLYVLDEGVIRSRCRAYREALGAYAGEGRVLYAGKAFLTKGMCRLVAEEGVGLDVVSGGELFTALQAGFPPERIYVHGNNKSSEELRMAIDAGVERIVVDSVAELELLQRLVAAAHRTVDVLLRITPGVKTATHAYVQTGQVDSKFGIPMLGDEAMRATKAALQAPNLRLHGFHSHIGSQILQLDAYEHAVNEVMEFCARVRDETGFVADEVNVGGGLGVDYSGDEKAPTPAWFVENIVQTMTAQARRHRLPLPRLVVEPGRSIVAEAGITLYTVGFIKNIPGVRTFATVDGGMGDNPRVALYQTRHRAVIANKAAQPPTEKVSVAGKYCESGDMLIFDLPLPKAQTDDVLAIFSTGAYNYSMASNYNRLPRPAVVLAKDGRHDVLVARETYADLVRHDRIPSWL